MFKVIFTFSVVTPLMIGSPFTEIESNQTIRGSELKGNTFKGIIRWWYRALMCSDNMKALKKEENYIFGSTVHSSRINLRIINKTLEIKKFEKDYWDKPEFNINLGQQEKDKINGLQYLSYNNYLVNQGNNSSRVRKFISPGSTFDIVLSSLDFDAFKNAVISFWFAVHFGGFGNRARRGYGNIRAINLQFLGDEKVQELFSRFEFVHNSNNIEDYRKTIINGLKNAKVTFPNINSDSNIGYHPYTCLKKSKLFIINDKGNTQYDKTTIKPPYQSWEDAMNEAGKRMQIFRKNYMPDKREILRAQKAAATVNNYVLEKPVFGLPISYRFSSGFKINVLHKSDQRLNYGDRFSSPVWISVLQLGSDFYPVFFFMFSNSSEGMDIFLKVDKYWSSSTFKYKNGSHVLNKFIKDYIQKSSIEVII